MPKYKSSTNKFFSYKRTRVERSEYDQERAITGEHFFWRSSPIAGVSLTESNTLGLTAYFCGINTLATDCASLPLSIYGRDENGDRQPVEHPNNILFKISPDDETTPIAFRQALMGHTLGFGNGYAEIIHYGNGDVASLHLLEPRTTRPRRIPDTNQLVYELADGRKLPPDKVLHIRGLGHDGLTGYTPLDLFRDTLSLSLGADKYGATYMSNASRPSGYLKVPGQMKQEAANRLRENWESIQGGLSNAGKTAVFTDGTEFVPLSIKPEDAQLLMTRAFQVLEIARILKMPPHKLMDMSQAHYDNLEAAERYYYMSTLRPWLISWEQELNVKLLKPSERESLYWHHNMEAVLRGSTEERTAHYKEMHGMGIYTANDILRLEDKPTIGREGDERFISANLKKANEQ